MAIEYVYIIILIYLITGIIIGKLVRDMYVVKNVCSPNVMTSFNRKIIMMIYLNSILLWGVWYIIVPALIFLDYIADRPNKKYIEGTPMNISSIFKIDVLFGKTYVSKRCYDTHK